MDNPVLVEVTRGHAGRIAPSRRRRGGRCGRRPRCCRLGDVERPRLSALRRQGAPGPAAGRERHRGAIRADRRGDRARLRVPFGRAGACGDGGRHAGQGRAGRRAASNAAPIGPWARRAGRALAAAGEQAERPAQQLLRQACGLRLPRLRARRGPEGLRAGRTTRSSEAVRAAWRTSPAPAHTAENARHRRLLDPDLRDAAAGARLRRSPSSAPAPACRGELRRRGAAHPRGRGAPSLHGGRHRPLRHRADGEPRRARLRQGRRGGRLLRGAARTRLRHRPEDRRRRRPRRRGRDGRA